MRPRNPWDDKDLGGKREPKGRIPRRQLLVRFVFYVVLFAVLIWWATS
ncbi:MAG: hypothetical protein IH867_10850 [Chloroflexi bacterium]|nr:hypothetical protein [Chloroflexota bacterium]